jgi:glycosyltransferase involved in cell wall biosynthesis
VHVVIDASVVQARLKGAGRVVVNLATFLPRAGGTHRFSVVGFPEGAALLRGRVEDSQVVEVPLVGGYSWERRGLATTAAGLGADAVLTLREIVTPGGPPTLMHVAEPPAYRLRGDLRRRTPKHVAKDVVLQSLLGRSIRHAAAVTAASEATAAWLRGRYRIDPQVIPPGIDPFFLEPGADPTTAPYLLHPATGDRRENTDLVLRAYAAATPPAALVMVGTPPQEADALVARAVALGIDREAVRVHGWVSDEELRDLYRGASVLIHPARYEGFVGLQPLEAMAQGTPVIALGAPGVTEALDGVAVLVADDASALGDAMRELLSDASRRSQIAARGSEFARAFTWERAARSFVGVLERLERGGVGEVD